MPYRCRASSVPHSTVSTHPPLCRTASPKPLAAPPHSHGWFPHSAPAIRRPACLTPDRLAASKALERSPPPSHGPAAKGASWPTFDNSSLLSVLVGPGAWLLACSYCSLLLLLLLLPLPTAHCHCCPLRLLLHPPGSLTRTLTCTHFLLIARGFVVLHPLCLFVPSPHRLP